jgi:excisionase family DNA binding protein
VPNNEEKVWYTVAETAEYLGVNERWVRRQIDDRKIRFNKLGATIRFHVDDLDDLVESGFIDPQQPLRDRGDHKRRHRTAERDVA